MKRKKPAPTVKFVDRDKHVYPAKRCADCGGLVIIGAEKFHDCVGRYERRYTVTVADGTRGMERGR